MRIRRAQMVALAAGGCLLLSAGNAGAGVPAVRCGATITKSVTLSADLTNCPGTGLVVGADGITLDLGGHTISGTNAPGGEGIADDGHAGVQIRNGAISDFRLNGVGLRGARRSIASGLVIRRIGAGGGENDPVSAGILVKDSPGSQVVANDVSNHVVAFQSDGVDVLGSAATVVSGNRLDNNNWDGLVLIASPGSRVSANALSGNGNNGVEVNGASDSTSVTGNHADGNTQIGIVVGSGQGMRVAGNSAKGNDTGLFFFDLHDSVIALNQAAGNNDGLDLAGGQFGSDKNRVVANDASRNNISGIGIFGGANDNVVTGNVANGNRGSIGNGGGIVVQGSTGNQLAWNVANGNSDTGIVLLDDQPGDTTGNSVKGNTANQNRNHGIDAVAGSIDGGGNRAAGNAVPPQCINVVCAG
ncbi:MAG: large repetitive protein [Gaiellales bacterium]|nr:large repetitive protein [Gaiellales bacterium]